MQIQVTEELREKYRLLLKELEGFGSAAVGFSGGVDSTFLLAAAKEALGNRVSAFTAESCFFPGREKEDAEAICRSLGVTQYHVAFRPLEVDGVSGNPRNRCYLCKTGIFTHFLRLAGELGIEKVLEGSNKSDEQSYRPGMRAVTELGVESPLKKAGLTKEEIRVLSRALGLPTWNRPSRACLASRFVYGETLTEEKLAMVDRAEGFLLDLGFPEVRVRIHGEDLARIEVPEEDFGRLLQNRALIIEEFLKTGFTHTALDLRGFRSGSMDEKAGRA